MFTMSYSQGRALLSVCGIETPAYAGRGEGRNNPAMQNRRNIGPLPRGRYAVGAPVGTHGPVTLPLTPHRGNEMHGRGGFLIHGDNVAGDASRGCIIADRETRDLIAAVWRHQGGELELLVTE